MAKSPSPRRVAIALIIHRPKAQDRPHFLIVSSRKHADRWVLPKGGIESSGGSSESGVESAEEAARREAWEEAGLIQNSSIHLSHLVVLPDQKPHKASPSQDPSESGFIPSTTYSFELFSVTSMDSTVLAEEWPEKQERKRRWVQGWSELKEVLCWGRRDDVMREALGLAKAKLG
ncbi:BZ3500_MvSof-1268-A1-R1_Chr1-3g01843 [Microbotryum saponariae]|uniref:BZ3500_MvSof-1268-A1-R1_Chr1-3g01843 protein n=1 Tax=Microbotryum saponariae TaxID=289078 RepID=A0A2X0L3N2_9BASI|nr:BZ3500_MvSof-1268-A1-R1_Chr1-3g01843 [Microbotryum saponariae]SCZ94732.1 BZ3501_MvSof-1269-A2-R1_Chr1-3g01445 [Microbotryum saponariae]